MYHEPSAIFGAWLDSFEWTTFATLTFRTKDHGSGPVEPTLKKCRASTEEALSNNGFQRAFWAAERGFEGRWHVHALLEAEARSDVALVSTRPTSRHAVEPAAKALDTYWRRKHGITRIERYLHARGASYYCGKYVTKRLADYDWWERDGDGG